MNFAAPWLVRALAAQCALALLVLGAACDGDDSGPSPITEGLVIIAKDYSYSPTNIFSGITGGTQLVLKNEGEEEHTFTIDDLRLSVEAAPGTSEIIRIPDSEVKDYDFYCRFHPDRMGGTITIR